MKTNVDIKKIAEYTILRLMQNGQSICPLKLQKLLYYIQAWHLVYFNEKIFKESPEAWVNGPVYRSVYNQYKNIGIYDNFKMEDFSISNEDLSNKILQETRELDLDTEQYNFLEAVFLHYGTMSHDKLVYLTHSEKPWNTARKGLSPIDYSDNKISLEEMKEYYKSLSRK